ncbi:DUF262 domain-containing protein [Hymenobacter glacialis]|uniref:DUF262 domain-containing protein n=1 Tax=Hymenobacter glacialis TaxID=1908236 RepID=A0A1G1T2H0_9BACT|nr:DUF262 domain-containing protein [Hymenobacter glacialis]OGX85056.1 hypothetical protein BEN48_15110 [Hymenobacter glacialis]
MRADYATPKGLFSNDRQYLVPLFQRSYAWGLKEWKTLWQDVRLLPELDDNRQHYIGAVVMYPTAATPTGVNKYAIIDGQQRMTTLFIMLVALRDVARQLGHGHLADRLTDNHLLNKYAVLSERHKLLPNQTDRAGLRHLTDAAPGVVVNQGRVADAYAFFQARISEWIAGQVARADELARLVLDRLSLVSITLDDNDDPYVVFESLNAKGLRLTAADLIRNYLFMRIQPDEQEQLNDQYWQPMQEQLGERLTQFVWHYLMRHGGNVPKSDVYFSFKKATERRPVPEILQELNRYAPTYARLLDPALETLRPAVRAALRRLHRTGLTVAYPMILRIYDKVRHDQAPESVLLDLLVVLENYSLRGFMAQRGTGGSNKSMQTLAARTNALDGQPTELLDDVRRYLATQNYPSDKEVWDALLNKPLYHHAGERNVRTKLVLETLETDLNPNETVTPDGLTIEHIMPQALTPVWHSDLGAESVRDHQTLLHTLGNLTLTGYNSELSNAPFAVKRVEFAKSNLSLNTELSTEVIWDAAVIRRRGAQLAERILLRWPSLAPELTVEGGGVMPSRAQSVRPKAVLLQGQRLPVRTWIEVVVVTLQALATMQPTLFSNLVRNRPTYLNQQPELLRSAAKVNASWYYEGHNSADGHRRFCRFALEQAGLTETEWSVETAEGEAG